jgi:IclR family pca regulon transcriptional regulator
LLHFLIDDRVARAARCENGVFQPLPADDRVLTLASAYLSSAIIPTVMQPIVERVSAQVGEACSAAVLDGDDVVFVARANPQRIISVGLEIGYRLPATSTAVGRVLLSGLADAELDDHLRRAEPKRFTAHTIVSRKGLKDAILASRSSGYSIVDQEVEQGFRSLAVPVVDIHGRISCALHIGTHVVNTPLETTSDALLPTLQAAARDASPMLL